MRSILLRILSVSLAGAFLTPLLAASDIPVGVLYYDLSTPPNEAQFDITNMTGPNSTGDASFPVSTTVLFSSLSLTVNYSGGGSAVFGSSYFTPNLDGISWDGTALSTTSPGPSGLFDATSAVLTGDFSTTNFTLFDGSTVTVNPGFSTTITDPSGFLVAGNDFALIDATPTGGGPPPVIPEPGTWVLVGTGGLLGLAAFRRRAANSPPVPALGSALKPTLGAGLAIGLGCLALLFPVQSHATTVKLNTWTSPSSGASGSTFVNVTGSGFPSGSIPDANVTLTLATSCGSSGTTAVVSNVQHIVGSVDRLDFEIPGLLAVGTYYVSLSGTTSTGNSFASGNCSEVQVTHSNAALAACLPSSSLAVLTGKNVTAYVPNSDWERDGSTSIFVVPIEGAGTAATIATANNVNSCSSNSQTGQTVCVANNTDVYLITGSTLNKTLTSNSDAQANFTGGSCNNCGVAINALNNTAVIGMGVSTGVNSAGLQILNLADNTFSPPFPAQTTISENMSIDPNRGLIISPNESGIYDLFKITPGTLSTLTEYENNISGGDLDSAAEDCTTGIALSTREFTNQLYITDLTQVTFTPPKAPAVAGTWTAPGQFVTFSEFSGFAAGTSGISVAAGTTHLGIVSGEFGGNQFGVFQLPATSGAGMPAFVDYAAAVMPTDPAGNSFSAGFDPHTITAYTSPNDGRAYGLLTDYSSGFPVYVGVIDLQKLLSAPRASGTHTVNPSYDLLANGVVRYVKIP